MNGLPFNANSQRSQSSHLKFLDCFRMVFLCTVLRTVVSGPVGVSVAPVSLRPCIR